MAKDNDSEIGNMDNDENENAISLMYTSRSEALTFRTINLFAALRIRGGINFTKSRVDGSDSRTLTNCKNVNGSTFILRSQGNFSQIKSTTA